MGQRGANRRRLVNHILALKALAFPAGRARSQDLLTPSEARLRVGCRLSGCRLGCPAAPQWKNQGKPGRVKESYAARS